jgi:hypothetical protein
MTSVLNVDTIADKAGTGPVGLTKQEAAKAYSNNDMTVPDIRKSLNVSSIADNGTGQSTTSLTSALSSTDSFATGVAGGDASTDRSNRTTTIGIKSTSTFLMYSTISGGSDADVENQAGLLMGDLA